MHSLNLVLLALVLTGLTGCRKNEEPPVESRAPISVVINSFQKLDFSEGAEQNRSESIEFDHLDELLEKLRSLETESSDFRYEIEIAIHKVSRADARIRIVTTSSTAQFQYFPDVDEPGNFTNRTHKRFRGIHCGKYRQAGF